MRALDLWLAAHSSLQNATSDFLDSCIALNQAVALPSTSMFGQPELETIAEKVQDRMALLDAVESSLQTSRQQLHVLLNASTMHVAINRLPPEMLGRIFKFVAATSECRFYDEILQNISLVCVRWRQTANRTPSLWSHIDIDVNQRSHQKVVERTRLWIDRSRSLPLLVHAVHSGYNPDQESLELVGELEPILRPHIRRVQSLILKGSASNQLAVTLFRLLPDHLDGHPLRSLVLSKLTLYGASHLVGFTWPTGLHGLVELNLSQLIDGLCPKITALATTLSNCPELHTLRLKVLVFPEDPLDVHPNIPLVHLRLLEINHVFSEDLPLLVSKLYPGTLELDVRLGFDFSEPGDLIPAVQSLLSRSNVVHLFLPSDQQDAGTPQLPGFLAAVPNLRALCISDSSATSSPDDGLNAPINLNANSNLRYLKSLALFNALIDSESRRRLDLAISAYGIRCVAFISCNFAPLRDYPGDANVSPVGGPTMTDGMKQWLLSRVEKFMVRSAIPTESYDGIDHFVQKLVNMN